MILKLVLDIIRKLLYFPLVVFEFTRRWVHFQRLANKFPGPPSLPIFGSIFDMGFPLSAMHTISYALDNMQKHDSCQMSLGPFKMFFIRDPRDVKRYLLNPANQFKPSFIYEAVSEGLGKGLITENEPLWKRHHKILLPTFHKETLHNQISISNRKSDILVGVLSEHAIGVPFDIKPLTEYVIMDIVIESLFEVPCDFLRKPDHELFDSINRGQEFYSYRIEHPWLLSKVIFYKFSSMGKKFTKYTDVCFKFCEKALRFREEVLNEKEGVQMNPVEIGTKKRYGVVDSMILHMRKGELTRDEVLNELMTMFLAGYDTTYSSILFCFYLLGKNPDVQEKVFLEIQNVFQENGSTEITLDILRRMKYLEMVIKECIRLYPPVWFHLRMTGVDTPLVTSDLVIPASGIVAISPKSMHMNSKFFPDPETFNPERFSEENSADRDPYAFLPFSMGNRACLGKRFAWMNIQVILCKVIWNFKLLPDPTYKPSFVWAVSSVPSNGMWLKLMKRRSNS